MKWLRLQVALLAIAVSVASAQCIVTCAAQPCHDSSVTQVPPCHRHHMPKHTDDSQACQHPFFVAEGRSVALNTAAAALQVNAFSLPGERVDGSVALSEDRLAPQEASPPLSPYLDSSTVLRV